MGKRLVQFSAHAEAAANVPVLSARPHPRGCGYPTGQAARTAAPVRVVSGEHETVRLSTPCFYYKAVLGPAV